jgi:hypothetical protein
VMKNWQSSGGRSGASTMVAFRSRPWLFNIKQIGGLCRKISRLPTRPPVKKQKRGSGRALPRPQKCSQITREIRP